MHTKIGANIFEAVGRENVFDDFGVHITLYAHLPTPTFKKPAEHISANIDWRRCA